VILIWMRLPYAVIGLELVRRLQNADFVYGPFAWNDAIADAADAFDLISSSA